MANEYIANGLLREANAAPCSCNGYADRMDESPSPDEIKRHDCGRRYACCTAVFKCRACGLRFIGKLDAPEMG
jgi:hypothetical protein